MFGRDAFSILRSISAPALPLSDGMWQSNSRRKRMATAHSGRVCAWPRDARGGNGSAIQSDRPIYCPEHDRGILWNDPALGIDWRVASDTAVLSDKDRKLPRLEDITSPFTYQRRHEEHDKIRDRNRRGGLHRLSARSLSRRHTRLSRHGRRQAHVCGEPRVACDGRGRCKLPLRLKADICDRSAIETVIAETQPDTIFHLAAESHVDRSITGSAAFIETMWSEHTRCSKQRVHIGRPLPRAANPSSGFCMSRRTEVYGSLGAEGLFTETTPYDPSSPYSASKAASDQSSRHCMAEDLWISRARPNCSNKYGPYHFPEKLIPLVFLNAMHGKPLRVYGDGLTCVMGFTSRIM